MANGLSVEKPSSHSGTLMSLKPGWDWRGCYAQKEAPGSGKIHSLSSMKWLFAFHRFENKKKSLNEMIPLETSQQEDGKGVVQQFHNQKSWLLT